MIKLKQAKKTLRSDAQHAVRECAGWNSRLAARRITSFLDARMADSGLTIAQFGLMSLIAAADDDTLGALAGRAGLDQSTLSRNLYGLARLGWVEIAAVEKDHRKRSAWLTETGAFKLQAAMPIWRRAHESLERALNTTLARRLADSAFQLPDEAES